MKHLRVILLIMIPGLVGCAGRSANTHGPKIEPSPPDISSEDEVMAIDDEFADFEEEFSDSNAVTSDPLETWNRAVFRFNDKAYDWVLRPVSRAYKAVTPEPVRLGTRNFFHNLAMPVRVVNCLLQGKLNSAAREVGRFGVNSVVGVFGCADAAADIFGWQAQDEDLGQTLGAWGLSGGPYLVWPLAGPSAVRDAAARSGDYFLKPLSYVDPWELEVTLKGVEYTNSASGSIEQYDTVKKEALEPYIAIREGFLQYRRRQIQE